MGTEVLVQMQRKIYLSKDEDESTSQIQVYLPFSDFDEPTGNKSNSTNSFKKLLLSKFLKKLLQTHQQR